MNRFLLGNLCLAVAVAAAGCHNNNIGTGTQPTPVVPVSEVFSGALSVNGAQSWPFSTGTAGTVTATLATVAPDSTAVVGLSLGTWNGAGCQIIIANDKATLGTTVTGTVSSAGLLCARVYDVGKVVDPVSYDVLVVHP